MRGCAFVPDRSGARESWSAALGLLALVALASEEAPFDVKDDTGTVHGPSWVSIVLLGLIVLFVAFALVLAMSAQRVTEGAVRVRRRRSVLRTLVLAAIACLLLLLVHASSTAKPKTTTREAPPDTEVASDPASAERDPGPPWAAFLLGGTVLVVLGLAAMTRRHLLVEAPEKPSEPRRRVLASLASSVEALGRAADDRAAIIAAYAALLAGLAQEGCHGESMRRPRSTCTGCSHRSTSRPAARRADLAVRRSPVQRASLGTGASSPCARCPRSRSRRPDGGRMIRRLVQLTMLSLIGTVILVASVPEKRTATIRLELWVLAVLAGALLLHLTRNRLPLTTDPLARQSKPEVPPGEPAAVESLAGAFVLAPSPSERVRRQRAHPAA